ncbi:HNH endonuclease signature motif containing protein [Kribbella sp. NPDC051952]|uniref:HNH endonuclease signature motif containing protein n=1 Tax=Kribbella sp. NPDC051952 TaxID=3154851 RepID=UPI00342EECAB
MPEEPGDLAGPRFVSEQDVWDAELDALLGRDRVSRVDGLEWELWDGVEQDAAEREMLRQAAPDWVLLPPGGALASALEGTRPQAMSPMALIELMKAANRLCGWAESIKASAMASFYRQRRAEHSESPRPTQLDSSGRPIDPERSWYGEIGLALGLSPNTVGPRVETALRLTSTLSATYTGLKCGALTWGKALAISEATSNLSDEAAQAVEAHVLKRAAKQTHKNLLVSLRRQVAKHTIHEAAEAHRAAVAERTCKIVPLADGMAGLWVVHTSDKIQQMWVVIQAMATLAKRNTPTPMNPTTALTTANAEAANPTTRLPAPVNREQDIVGPVSSAGPRDVGSIGGDSATQAWSSGCSTASKGADVVSGDGAEHDVGGAHGGGGEEAVGRDGRSVEQRRADVAADLFEQILHNGLDWLGRRLPDQHRRRPHIEVVVPASTLLGLDDDPAELTGYGPIPADMARRIAADGTWRRLLTDPTNGTVLEASTTRHDPGVLVTETLLARHPVCAWPGCNRTSRDCDRDHTTPFARTGTTSLTGLAPYCEYHHVIKDTPAWGWTTTSHPDGSITLTTPTGHRYTTVPPARGPLTQPPSTEPTPTPKPHIARTHTAEPRTAGNHAAGSHPAGNEAVGNDAAKRHPRGALPMPPSEQAAYLEPPPF